MISGSFRINFISKRFAESTHWFVGRVFANDPGDWGSIPGRVIPNTQKVIFDATSLNTQYYKFKLVAFHRSLSDC